ncbi:MAG: phosphatase PAP2 family protein [Gammaproteobacteria bacterium]|nr:phosphatase PAP2 family protein [Gammaproteobacteria bacterium]
MNFDRQFWLSHAFWPLLLFLLIAVAAVVTGLDRNLEQSWAFDPIARHFVGEGAGSWWARSLIHDAGGAVIRGLGLLMLLAWVATFFFEPLRRWRRPVGFAILCVALGAGTVGLLKQATNIACPRALTEFGGDRPYVGLLDARPATLPRARCFPGGHSSSGFALFPMYFLCIARDCRRARRALLLALGVGALFAFGQEARGAHFLSHDIWSAAIMWFACLGVFVIGYRGEVWEPERRTCRVDPLPDQPT